MRAACLLVLAACFHAHGTVKDAQDATYKRTGAQMLTLAEDVVKKTYKLGDVDAKKLVFTTQRQTYAADGKAAGSGAGSGKQYEVQLVVEVLELAGGDCSVTVKARTFERGKELDAMDPDIPDFVHQRASDLAVAIYDQAKPYAYTH